MANSFADTFIQAALQQNEKQINPNAGSGFAEGAQIAFHAQQLQQQNQEIEMKKQQIQMAKLDKVANWFEAGSKMDDGGAKKAFLGNYIPNGINALGLTDTFHPDTLKMMSSNPLIVPYAKNEIAQGRLDASTLYSALAQPDKMADLLASKGFKQFGAAEDVKAALQDSIGGLVKVADERAKFQTSLNVAGIRATATNNPDKQLENFGKEVANPSARSSLGIAKQMVDSADAVKQLTESYVPKNATPEQRVAAYDKLDRRQVAEVVRSLDRLLSRSAPTVHGQETLTPDTVEGLFMKYGEKGLGTPQGLNQGKFIERMVDSVDRERKMNADKFRNAATLLKSTKVRAASQHSDVMDKVIEDAVKVPSTGNDSNGGGVIYKGKDAVWLQSFLKDHPADPQAKAIKDALKKAGY